ncbi:hypothetical protein BU23DRAFT_266248 [Bimuria novae-zelandiae CBS 107.79]|uniref:Uncharacterized protein n=1 Tax=Bimuria novae-zelandiae CBS 107.79 TaxID=1447943 RepID=A0A6A5UU93_9PLEO|nr:hypothetical protein BU23DRAFT_266248 [Bimuria novae-zelandiae CBS 107.79]
MVQGRVSKTLARHGTSSARARASACAAASTSVRARSRAAASAAAFLSSSSLTYCLTTFIFATSPNSSFSILIIAEGKHAIVKRVRGTAAALEHHGVLKHSLNRRQSIW